MEHRQAALRRRVPVPLYADHVCRIIAALRGKSRRCLILDLDNTLWSGVIGDDGLEGIVIGQGDPTGEAHLAVQQTALMLRERGIVLAVSSKNHDEIARLPFRKHQEMLLKGRSFGRISGQLGRQGEPTSRRSRRGCHSASTRWCSSTTTR